MPPEPRNSMIGQTVSHFEILEKIGQGGMGAVYKAQDLLLDRFTVLKFLLPYLGQNEEAKQRFVREAKAASATAFGQNPSSLPNAVVGHQETQPSIVA